MHVLFTMEVFSPCSQYYLGVCIQLGVSIPLYLAAKDMYTVIADLTNRSITGCLIVKRVKLNGSEWKKYQFFLKLGMKSPVSD